MIFRAGHQNPAGHREELMMDSRFGEAALAMTLAALVFGFATAAHAQGKWRAGAPIPQGANEVIGAEIDGQVLVYGGQDPGNNAMGIFWKFDPTKNEWSKLPSNPVPVHHGASASIGHKFYVFGGFRLPDTGKVGWYPENKAWASSADADDAWCARGGGRRPEDIRERWRRHSAGYAASRWPRRRRPGRSLQHTRSVRYRYQYVDKACTDAHPAESPQYRLRRRQALRHRWAGGLVLFGRLVVECVDERGL